MKEMNLFCLITNLTVILLVGIIFTVLPALTRKTLLFGVKVPESAQSHPEARGMKRGYVWICLIGMLLMLVLAIVQYVIWPELTLVSTMYFPIALIPIQALAYIPNWKKALALKARERWTPSETVFSELRSSYTRGRVSSVPWLYYAVAFIIIAVCFILTLMKYPDMPDPMPIHFDINMNPDAWTDKSLLSALTMPLTNLLIFACMLPCAVIVVKAKLQLDHSNPALSFAQHRAYRRLLSHGAGILTLGMVLGFALINLSTIYPSFRLSFGLIMTFMLVPCVPLVIFAIACGQGGCRLRPKITEADAAAAGYSTPDSAVMSIPGRGDDRFWALGMFYHNPDDPSILVEDRFGTNIGLNYAHTGVKLGVTVLVAALVVMYVLLTPVLIAAA